MARWPDVDIVVASPNLPGGGYRHVPAKRVWVSRFGNRVIRLCMANTVTMNTGMTRAYRRDVIQSLPLTEPGKEFHLEVILKATAFGHKIREIPAVLEWKQHKRQGQVVKRKSSSKVNRLIVSHSLFSIFANPVRYVWLLSFLFVAMGFVFIAGAFVLFYLRQVSAYTMLFGLSLFDRGHAALRAGRGAEAGQHHSARALADAAGRPAARRRRARAGQQDQRFRRAPPARVTPSGSLRQTRRASPPES